MFNASVVRTADGLTDTYVTMSVCQRCVLLLLLFNIYIDRIINEAQMRKENQIDLEQEDRGIEPHLINYFSQRTRALFLKIKNNCNIISIHL